MPFLIERVDNLRVTINTPILSHSKIPTPSNPQSFDHNFYVILYKLKMTCCHFRLCGMYQSHPCTCTRKLLFRPVLPLSWELKFLFDRILEQLRKPLLCHVGEFRWLLAIVAWQSDVPAEK
jgi:hypothetical protein